MAASASAASCSRAAAFRAAAVATLSAASSATKFETSACDARLCAVAFPYLCTAPAAIAKVHLMGCLGHGCHNWHVSHRTPCSTVRSFRLRCAGGSPTKHVVFHRL